MKNEKLKIQERPKIGMMRRRGKKRKSGKPITMHEEKRVKILREEEEAKRLFSSS